MAARCSPLPARAPSRSLLQNGETLAEIAKSYAVDISMISRL
jgi:hypothetical protein